MTFHESEVGRGDQGDERSRLPIGFRFCPTDEELVSYFLTNKNLNRTLVFDAIGEVDFNQCEPWDLQVHAKTLGNVFYFFSLRDRKYPTGMRTNRATRAGYWKATGKDRQVKITGTVDVVGMKKTLVFYTGRAPAGERTDWVMHEYRSTCESRPDQQQLAVCRVFKKSTSSKTIAPQTNHSIAHNAPGYSAGVHFGSFLPTLQSLESSQSTCQFVTYNGDAASIRQSNSTLKMENELSLGDTLENLVAGWDGYSPASPDLWDIGTGVGS